MFHPPHMLKITPAQARYRAKRKDYILRVWSACRLLINLRDLRSLFSQPARADCQETTVRPRGFSRTGGRNSLTNLKDA